MGSAHTSGCWVEEAHSQELTEGGNSATVVTAWLRKLAGCGVDLPCILRTRVQHVAYIRC